MANKAWEAEKAQQLGRIKDALDEDPSLRTDPAGLAEQAQVPVNRVVRYLSHEVDPVDTVKNVARRTGRDHRVVRDNAEADGLRLTDLQMRHIDDDLVLRLADDEGLSCRAIARKTGYSPGGVSHALRRARAAREASATPAPDPIQLLAAAAQEFLQGKNPTANTPRHN